MKPALEQSRVFWDAHASRDPLWAILSDPPKKGARWDVGRFFQTGVAEIAALLYELDSRRIAYRRKAALDFGCGVGRLTQALATCFDRIVGVDVSPKMLELARQLNQHPDKVSYVCNAAPDLEVFADRTFDVVISNVVLQHIQPDIALHYLAEFFRVATPNGILVFQLPSHQRPPDERRAPIGATVMPDASYQMSIDVAGVPERLIEPGSAITVDVQVTNISPVDWSRDAYGVISIGNHWVDSAGRMLQRDDGRTALPMLQSGEACRQPLTITVPQDAAACWCEIDLAHEGVLWFSDRGAAVARFPVRVGRQEPFEAQVSPAHHVIVQPSANHFASAPRMLAGPSLASDDPGDFPMHGMRSEMVEQLIADHGATLLHIEHDRSCGDEWISYRYFVRTAALERPSHPVLASS